MILRDKRGINTINTTNNPIPIRKFDIIRKLASVSAMREDLVRTEGDVRETPLHIGRPGDHDDDETERESDENDSNVADGDVRATPLHTGRTGGNIGRTGDYDDDDRDDENSSYVDDGHDIGGVRYISCDVTREAIWCIFLTGPPTG